jgi:hypothetical protein
LSVGLRSIASTVYIQVASPKLITHNQVSNSDSDMLIFLSDEDTAFEYASSRKIDPSIQKLLRETWEDNFTLVGEQLLEKIESKQSDLVPLEDPT